VAKNRTRTDWQIDLKPVARTTAPDRAASANGHGSYPSGVALPPPAAPEPTPAVASPALFKALGELRATDEALLDSLGEIRVVMHGMRASIDELAVRMAAIEAMLASQPTGSPRPVRETSRTLRDSSTVPLERRTRRAPAPNPAEGTAQ
jgi:hypothetical protein